MQIHFNAPDEKTRKFQAILKLQGSDQSKFLREIVLKHIKKYEKLLSI